MQQKRRLQVVALEKEKKMNICLYGAANDNIDRKYIEATFSLCKKLGEHGHTLVFGGGGVSVMGAAARGFQAGGGKVTGVVPRFFKDQGIEDLYTKCDKYIYTYTLAERKSIMEDNAEAFIIAPGGIGTYDEFFQVLTLKHLGVHNKPIAVYNIDGFYDTMQNMMLNADREGFLRSHTLECYRICTTEDEVTSYLRNK